VKLSPAPLVATGDVTSRALVSPDGQRLVFQGDLETEGRARAVERTHRWKRARCEGQRHDGGGRRDLLLSASIHPDGARVVFQVDRETDEVRELYSAPSDGSAPPVKLSGAMVTGGDVLEFAIAPDAMHVAFIADRLTDEVFELFVSAVDGSAAPVRLSGSLVAGGDVDWRVLEISPDGVWVAFVADA
jgi:hypothetical protein